MTTPRYFVYYNSDEDQLYVKSAVSYTAWFSVKNTTVTTIFCGKCNFWHYIGEL